MFKFKLNTGTVIDATKKSVVINNKGTKDGIRVITGDVINSETSITRFIIEDLKSIVTDNGEIEIDTTKDISEVVNDIKAAFKTHNIPTQNDSEAGNDEENPGENTNPETPEQNQTVTVTYLVDGEEYFTETGVPGEMYKMTIPTKNGYNFVGWEPDDNNQTFPTENTTYNAVFEPIPVEVLPTEDEPEPQVVRDVFHLYSLGSTTSIEGSIDDLFNSLSWHEDTTFGGASLAAIEPSDELTAAHDAGDFSNVTISAEATGGEIVTDQSVFDPTNFKIMVSEGTTSVDIIVTTTITA